MGAAIKKGQPATSSEYGNSTQGMDASKRNSTLRIRDIAIAVGFGVGG